MNLDVTLALSFSNFVILLAGIIASYLVIRSTLSRTGQDLQDRIRIALMDENTILQQRLVRLEEDMKRLEEEKQNLAEQIRQIIALFKKRGTEIIISDDQIEVRDPQRSSTVVSRKAKESS